jgi:hypothetical protein
MRVTGLLKSTCGKGTRRMQFIATLEGAEMVREPANIICQNRCDRCGLDIRTNAGLSWISTHTSLKRESTMQPIMNADSVRRRLDKIFVGTN